MPDAPPQPLLLQLLAAPRLLAGGRALHVGSRKALALLALLALDGSTTRERLTALLWPEADAAAGRRNLRRELFRLRKLGVPLVEAADGALTLAAALTVDALQLLREGRLPAARGQALEGLDGVASPELDAWLQRWRAQLAQRLGQLLSVEAEALEQRGELAGALVLQQQRWAADACDEAAALQVLRLQAELGDRAGALQSFQRLTEALRDELDIAPSTDVQAFALELRRQVVQAVLPSPSPSPTSPGGPPGATATAAPGLPARVPFVSRGAAQQAIETAWARGQRVYLHGAAGAGKSRLASELAAARGPWLRVACEPQDAELPYASVVRLLRALRESAPDVVLPDWVRRELAQLMPELGPPPQVVATDEARQRLLTAVVEGWRALMQDNFSALVLDDWQWGDAASVALWARLDDPPQASVKNPAGPAPVVWIVAYRSAQLPSAALQRQRADVDSGRGVAIALEGMDEAEVLALTRALSGAAGGQRFAQRLHAATEGNPFFLLETLRHLFAQRLLVAEAVGWSTPFDDITQDYAELPVPASVHAAVQARVRALGVPLQRLLEVASLCSGEFDARLLAGAAAGDEEAVVAALEHAHAAQLVHAGATGWCFAHDLVRQSLLQGLSAARRRMLHERLAGQLEQAGAAPALVAAQWEAAQQPAAAVRWRVAAAESALRVHALSEALAHFGQALADGAKGAAAVAIHLACLPVHARRTDRAAADAVLDAATEAAASDAATGPTEVLRVQLARANHLRQTDRADAALVLLDALAPELAQAGPAQRAQALTTRGAVLMVQGHQNRALALLHQAAELLDGLPEARAQLAQLLLEMARSYNRCGDMPAWGRLAQRAVVVYESIDDVSGLARSVSMLAAYYIDHGDRAKALVTTERARQLAQRCGDVSAQRFAILNLVKLCFDAGETERAWALLDEGDALAAGFEQRSSTPSFLAARFYLHLQLGELAQAHASADLLLALGERDIGPVQRIGFRQMVADMYLMEGGLARARAALDEAQTLCDALESSAEGNHYAPGQAIAMAWLALAEGRASDALARLPAGDALPRLEDRFGWAWIGCAAARALGDEADARRRLESVALGDDVGGPLFVLWLEQRLALAASSRCADVPALDRARELLSERRVPVLLAPRLQAQVDANATI